MVMVHHWWWSTGGNIVSGSGGSVFNGVSDGDEVLPSKCVGKLILQNSISNPFSPLSPSQSMTVE